MAFNKKIVRNGVIVGLTVALASPAAVSMNGGEAYAASVCGTYAVLQNCAAPDMNAAMVLVNTAAVGKTAGIQNATDKKTTTKKSTTKKDGNNQSGSSKPSAKKSAETIKKNKKTAEKYIGKKLTSLVKKIGKYKKLTKAKSCYYSGEYDGIAEFDGFKVYCHTKNKKTWYVDSVE